MTEVRLLQLLQRAQTDSPIDMIQSVVSGYHVSSDREVSGPISD